MAGFIGIMNAAHDPATVDAMRATIQHRGPDYRLDYHDDTVTLSYLGLDLDYAFDRQELFEDEQLVVLLVGYLANIDELRQQTGRADAAPSALIAALYQEKGQAVADALKGGYIVLIYEKQAQRVTLIRDRFGSQPLYYYQTDGGLIVASEIKALLKHPAVKKALNTEALVPYLIFQVPVLEETFFKNIYELPQAARLTYQNGRLTTEAYWDQHFTETPMTLQDAAGGINTLIGQSIEKRLKYFHHPEQIVQSLSGGVDSSYLAARIRPQRTFTVGYHNKEFSEIDNARAFSQVIGAEHTAKLIDAETAFSELERIIYLNDVPDANLSAIPMYYLSKTISQTAHAAFSGEGSDEFFGGYAEYAAPSILKTYKHLPQGLRRLLAQHVLHSERDFKGRNFLLKGLPVRNWFIGQNKVFHENNARDIVTAPFQQAPTLREITGPYYERAAAYTELQQQQYLDMHLFMIYDIALKADRMNIGNSVQLVTPLLDEDLLAFALQLPDELKVQDDRVKIAFRTAAEQYLPDEWAKRKKLGYVTPLRIWLREPQYARLIRSTLLSERSAQFFDQDIIADLIQEDEVGKRRQHRKLWTLYMFLKWHEQFFG